ncbi:MAG: ATP-binding protein [Hamadaea sp.]|uniref:sensor histidine kinase n=1 Tax=Hamadaea sp. TaxID=2024425 RepID=UPI0017CA8307|nr:nitrate- and nitrite sensing domain-containing protein [Hamadaea sp.]NUR74256.1 ATP-binding protein [Hamadaea sp.]NUT22977.1 ATP-binding protein [Hamadaea sp.]
MRTTSGVTRLEREPAQHGRRSPLRSIRIRLLLPIGVATIGMTVLGVLQSGSALTTAQEGERARTLAWGLTATVKLNHQVEQEIAETADLLLRGGKTGQQLLTAQQARTDAAVENYDQAAAAVAKLAPDMAAAVAAARGELAKLPLVRDAAMHPENEDDDQALFDSSHSGSPDDGTPEAAYDDLTHALVTVAETISAEPMAPALAENARIVATLSAAEHRAAEERSLLREVFGRGRFQPGELAELAELRGSESDRIAQLSSVASTTTRERYATTVQGPDVEQAARLVEGALRYESQPEALKVDPDTWYIAQTNAMRKVYLFQLDVISMLEQDAAVLEADSRNEATTITGVTAGLVAMSLGAAVALAVQTSRRLRKLRAGAHQVTSTELPEAIAEVSLAPSPQTVRDVEHASQERVTAWLAPGSDEIGELSTALSGLHRQALRLAADQALLRMDVARIFVALSRRGQTLVQRQLQLLDEFEKAETDPDTLGRLFQLDHLAARMRRNEENLLVLAGAEPGRAFVEPESLADVVMAAAAEIEQYSRIDTSSIAEIWIDATAVGDLVHLLAELLENAVVFSPPGSKVQVSTHRTVDELTITVYDHGIGIGPEQLAELNEQLRRPVVLTGELVSRMGLLVVARLAQRLRVQVELRSAPSAGTVALVQLPNRMLLPAHAVMPRIRPDSGPPNTSDTPSSPAPSLNGSAGIVRGRATVVAAAATGVIDPDLARARLSSLASGLAAAQRHAPPPV